MRKLLLLLVFLAVFANFIFADPTPIPSPQQVTDSGVLTAVNGVFNAIQNLPQNISNSFITSFKTSTQNGLAGASQTLMNKTFDFIYVTPDLASFCGPFNLIMGILTGLYTIFLLLIGAYFIFGSVDVESRIKAKKYLRNFIIALALLSLSFYFFELLLKLNGFVVSQIGQVTIDQAFRIPSGVGGFVLSFLTLIFSIILMLFVNATLFIRYILIPFLLLLFPVALLLLFVPGTKNFGKSILKLTFLTIFMGAIDALFLLAFTTLASAQSGTLSDFTQMFITIAGFALLFFLNVVLLVWGLLPSFKSVTKVIVIGKNAIG